MYQNRPSKFYQLPFDQGVQIVIPPRSPASIHCWKKKRDFRIIRSKVDGFLTQSVADNEYFVGWKENKLNKYHLKWVQIIF